MSSSKQQLSSATGKHVGDKDGKEGNPSKDGGGASKDHPPGQSKESKVTNDKALTKFGLRPDGTARAEKKGNSLPIKDSEI